MGKTYTLKCKNKSLIDFTDNTDISQKGDSKYPITVEKIYEENTFLLPIDLKEPTGDKLLTWIINRKIPKGRKNATLLLEKYDLKNRVFGYIDLAKGLSLTDVYWVVPYGSKATWEDCNLYKHSFNELIATLAFTGESEAISKEHIQSSPEFTTNGALPKKWIRRDHKIFLIKGIGVMLNNEDGRNEPFSEMYASQLAEYLKLPHIPYEVELFTHSNGHKEYISVCPLYTTEKKSYVPMVKLLNEKNIDYRLLDTEQEERKIAQAFTSETSFADMILFDSLIGNTDRHLNNFGVIVNSNTNEIIEPMPIFDNGGAFWIGTYLEQLERNPEMLFKTENTSFDVSAPLLYKRFARPRHKEMLESIMSFKFNRNTPYRLPEHTLQVLESNMQVRAKIMLEILKTTQNS